MQPSAETQLIIELLEKIRRLNDTTRDLNQQPSPSQNPLIAVDALLTQAEKQLSGGYLVELHDTLLELRGAMEEANAETQRISASTTLSRIYTSYQEYYARVEQLEKELTIKLSSSQTQFPLLLDDIGKIEGLFYLMPWIEAVRGGKPYNSTEPIKQKVDERIPALNTSIVEAESRLSSLVESKQNATTLTNIYKAWDLLKDANLSLLSGDVDRADELFQEATLIMESLR